MCVFGSYRKLGQTENHFCVDCKIRAHSCKSISGFIFTSNHLHSSHNTPSSSQITHSSHSPTVLSILSHMHSSLIAHPSIGESHPNTGEIALQTHPPIDPPRPPVRSHHEPTNWSTHPVSDPLLDRPTSSTSESHPRTNLSLSLSHDWSCDFDFSVLIFVSCVVYIFWFSVIIFV